MIGLSEGGPRRIRSYNRQEITSIAIQEWLARVRVKTLFIEPDSPWKNGYVKSFHGKLLDELLDWEVFETLLEA